MSNWPLLVTLLSSQILAPGSIFALKAWSAEDGKSLDPSWSASTIYAKLRQNKLTAQGVWVNSKWGFVWPLPRWLICWRYMSLKGLSQRNKIFVWRISVAAFYVGKNAWRLGFSDFSCTFCGGGVEDISHVIWLCPRWYGFWLDVSRRLPGWEQILPLRDHLLTLPHVLFWAVNAPSNEALFKVWFLAVAWRVLWAERCTAKFQGKLNSVSLTKIVICLLEEINARCSALDPNWVKEFVRPLISVLSVVPNRFHRLLVETQGALIRSSGQGMKTLISGT
ncbi:hypothetical protein R1sor_024631 [Riccia sorocarpa]|uniref:Reverse transcriptase zinc-binding domain-containing protein n=1 Tax=Riccia sorocarpa TaxID=122646 RepID=A0ABD3GR20_9MARC